MAVGGELEGITVVSIEQAVAAPYCGLLLADAGARVIKIEREGGDFARDYDRAANGGSAYFVWLNRGKESIVLDLASAGDLALLKRMLARADVLLQNLAPGSLERKGISGPTLRETNPGLITCEITGYGRAGPYAQMKAYDLLVQAESGLCSVTGSADAPARVGISICDIATGLTAFSGILRALLLRGRTGVGTDLSIAMFDVMADWMNVPLLYERYAAAAPQRMGVRHPTLAPYGVYRAADGELLVAIQSNREWRSFCADVLGQPELGTEAMFLTNEDRVRNRSQLDAHIERYFARYPRDQLLDLLRRKQIACASLNSVAGLDRHPQLRNQPALFAGGEALLADLPVRINGNRPTQVPALDEHGAGLRAEFTPESDVRSTGRS
ncbi:MAG: CaiB/BaiF CoA transferase family protein [Parvibaculaceae bacterium]